MPFSTKEDPPEQIFFRKDFKIQIVQLVFLTFSAEIGVLNGMLNELMVKAHSRLKSPKQTTSVITRKTCTEHSGCRDLHTDIDLTQNG